MLDWLEHWIGLILATKHVFVTYRSLNCISYFRWLLFCFMVTFQTGNFWLLTIVLHGLLSNSVNQDEQYGTLTVNEGDSRKSSYDLESVLSLDDGRWSVPVEKSCSLATNFAQEGSVQLNIRQPSPPPVLAEVQPAVPAISPSKVADPRPGPPKRSLDGMPDSKEYQDLHVVSSLSLWCVCMCPTNSLKGSGKWTC